MIPLVLFALAALSSPALRAADWPQFLGPTRDGVYSGADLAPAPRPALLWKKDIGQGFSAPVVAQGKLLVFHRNGGKETVEALDPATGKRLWATDSATSYRDDFGFDEGPRATPAVEGNRVYTHGADGFIQALDLATGKRLWSVDTRRAFEFRKGFFGSVSSPLVEGDAVLVGVGAANGAGIVAFHKDTGKTLWTATSDEAGYGSPMMAAIGGARLALFFNRAGLTALDAASGAVRFQFPWRARSHASVNAATPVVSGDLVFLSASYGTGAVLLQIKPAGPKPVWSSDDAMSNHYATCVLRDGYLYGYHGRQEEGQSLRAVELKTGKVQWNVERFGAGTVTLAGNRLLLVREDGEWNVAEANPKEFRVLSKAQLLPATIRAYPAIAAGRLYVRDTKTLAAFDLRK
jgi:outer membrane protein assembly factor BamB